MADFSFFWHDYETFGPEPRRDAPAQFAGVRTDAALNEIGEPLALYCRPPLDRLPDPESALITGLLPQQLSEAGVAEHAFAEAVHRELARPGTVGVGYNSIRFDDEVTRFLLWRNLFDPYAREWRDECGRWDLLDVLRCAWALRPQGLHWPTREDGKPSFKLQDLTAANGVAHESAHDALSDVRATLGLARLLRASQPRLWDFCLKLRSKHEVARELQLGRPALHISGMYPAERGCMAVVFPLGTHPSRRNEVLCWDLSHDPEVLRTLDVAQIRQRLFTRTADLPEGVTRLPLKTVHLNRAPVVIANLGVLEPGRAERFGVDLQAVQRHAAAASRLVGEMAGVWPEVYAEAAREPADVDEDLYGAFVPDEDRRLLEQLRARSPEELARIRPAFRDERLEELLFRYRARNFPHTLGEGEQARWQAHRHARLHDGAHGSLALQPFLDRVDSLIEQAGEQGDERAESILSALVEWATEIAPER